MRSFSQKRLMVTWTQQSANKSQGISQVKCLTKTCSRLALGRKANYEVRSLVRSLVRLFLALRSFPRTSVPKKKKKRQLKG